jgi:hypothetical protein
MFSFRELEVRNPPSWKALAKRCWSGAFPLRWYAGNAGMDERFLDCGWAERKEKWSRRQSGRVWDVIWYGEEEVEEERKERAGTMYRAPTGKGNSTLEIKVESRRDI